MRLYRTFTTLAMAIGMLLPLHAIAGRSCEDKRPSAVTFVRGINLAQRTQDALEAEHGGEGTIVVILARAGQDLSKYHLQYSHLGLAYRIQDPAGRPVWRVLHKLNYCASTQASLYRQGLAEFFLDDLWRFEAAWVTPTPTVQRELHRLVRENALALQLHHSEYNLVSYPWSTRYQQSNQWVIEMIAAASSPVSTRRAAQDWLKTAGYQPTELRLGTLHRLGGRLSAANVSFEDHPPERRWAGRIQTVTADSVFAWTTLARITTPIRKLSL